MHELLNVFALRLGQKQRIQHLNSVGPTYQALPGHGKFVGKFIQMTGGRVELA